MSFFGFSALVPFLALAVTLYGLVSDASDVADLTERIGNVAPREVTAFISDQLTTVATSSSSALSASLVISLATGLWGASSGMGHLIEAMNIAYDEDTDDRPFWKRRLIAVALTVWFLVSLGACVAVVVVSGSLAAGVLGAALQLGGWSIAGFVAAIALAVLYRFSPDRDEPEWLWVSPGAIFTVVAWVVASIGFRFYVANFGSYNETYGSLGAVVVLLFWLYLSALVVIIGAEINAETERQTAADTTTGPDQPIGSRGAVVADEPPPSE